jgi:excisionase family DNA binding protein
MSVRSTGLSDAERGQAEGASRRGPPIHEVEPLAVRPSIAWRLLDCGNTHGYELLAAGELESYRDGRSRRITMRSIKAYIARQLTAAAPSEAASPPRRRGRPRKSSAVVTERACPP